MCSAGDNAALPALGFPIRESAGHRPFSASPRLIAAVHALHRLLVPRHPPCALTILTVIEPNGSVIPVRDRVGERSRIYVATVQFSRTAGGVRPAWWRRYRDMRDVAGRGAGLSKLNSMPATRSGAQE